jgi:hypothetical protein
VQPDPSRGAPPTTVAAALDNVLDTYDSLATLGEEIEDEWQYIQDLTATWHERLAAVDTRRGAEILAPDAAAAVTWASDEAALITDPHRAIDWLSTFPQVVLVTLGERP